MVRELRKQGSEAAASALEEVAVRAERDRADGQQAATGAKQ